MKYMCTDQIIPLKDMPPGSKELSTIVSSLRLDTIASAGLNISRKSVSVSSSITLRHNTQSLAGLCGGIF